MKKDDQIKFHKCTITTDIYKADLSVHAPKELIPALTEAYEKIMAKDKSIVVKLLHWIEKYPDVPQFKNFLCMYYSLTGNNEKAFEVNNELLEQFPDYLYAKINKAQFYLSNNEPEKVPEILGENMELAELYPERKIFHHEEYINFYKTVAEYYCDIGEQEKAEAILENLYTVEEKLELEINLKSIEQYVMLSRLKNADLDRFIKNPEEITQRKKPTLQQTKKPPVFHYPQISWLYQYGFADMPDEKIHELLSLEKEWLRIDLETVVYDAIRRYEFFNKQEYDDSKHSFCLHALYLLKEIKAEESLPVVLELLRQPQEVLELWLGDILTDNMWQVIYVLALNQTEKLMAFLKEPLNYAFARVLIPDSLTQIAIHHPERREEIIEHCREVIYYFINHKANKEIIDETVIGFMIDDLAEMKAEKLLPEIQTLFEEELVDESITGELEDIIAQMDEVLQDNNDFKKDLQNYFEIKEEIASWENDESDEDDEFNITDEYEEENKKEYYDDWEEIDEEEEDATQYFYSGSKPFVHTTPKVGRNDPCPCGSGKKYKKCCGKSE